MDKSHSQLGSAHIFIICMLLILLVSVIGFVSYQNFIKIKTTTKSTQVTPSITSTKSTQVTTEETTAIEQPKTLLKGDFGDDGNYGMLQVEGYVTVVEREKINDVGYCGENGELCDNISYAFFNITRSENNNIFTFINNWIGNAFVQKNAIGIGCVEDDAISYFNNSDAAGMSEYSIGKEDSAKILAATFEEPIILEIERLKYSSGGGAPACYSHFTTFKVVE